uniref:RNase_Zc3h12a domain-containing protein n=1 Tax=Globodera pallida TaxID=36090 RepID=A0A183C0L2_GLOPA
MAENLLALSSDDSCDDDLCCPPSCAVPKTAIRRMAIIDVCNVLYCCAYHTSAGKALNERCDATGLIVMARSLLKAGFDLKMFVPISYMNNSKSVHNKFIMEELQKLDYLTVIDDGSHDDFFPLEVAKCNGGFVISNDRFRDHRVRTEVPDGLRQIIDSRNVQFAFHHVPIDKVGKNALSDPAKLGYLELEFTLKPPSLSAMFALSPADPSYGMVFSQRILRSEKRALEMLERLDVMSEYLLQLMCENHGIKRSLKHMNMFEMERMPTEFERFWRHYDLYQTNG